MASIHARPRQPTLPTPPTLPARPSPATKGYAGLHRVPEPRLVPQALDSWGRPTGAGPAILPQ